MYEHIRTRYISTSICHHVLFVPTESPWRNSPATGFTSTEVWIQWPCPKLPPQADQPAQTQSLHEVFFRTRFRSVGWHYDDIDGRSAGTEPTVWV